MLETARLLLPPLTEEHIAPLAALYRDPEVTRFIGGDTLDPEATAAQVTAFGLVWQERGFGQSAVIDRATGQFLGRVGLHPWPVWDEIEVGWVLARTAQSKGFAAEAAARWITYAFTELGLTRLTAVIDPRNEPSRRLAVRLGFAVHRQDQIRETDVLVYELLPARQH